MAHAHEQKHNRYRTKGLIQSNPDTDMRRQIVGNVSKWTWMERTRVEEVL
jgi:hypothetical protein